MMWSRSNLIVFIIPALCTSVFGGPYVIDVNRGAHIEVCHDDDNRINTYAIDQEPFSDLPYDYFNENIIVRAYGHFEVGSFVVKPIITEVLLLNKYVELDNSKVYEGELHLKEWDFWERHISHVGVKLTIPRSGVPRLRNYVYAGAWEARYCPHAISNIKFIKVFD